MFSIYEEVGLTWPLQTVGLYLEVAGKGGFAVQNIIYMYLQEREGYKRVIDSYESEVTVNIGAQAASRIQQLEEIVQAYRKQTEQLEAELNRVSTEVQHSRSNGVKVRNI